jgi:hypothetical protein
MMAAESCCGHNQKQTRTDAGCLLLETLHRLHAYFVLHQLLR